MTSIRTSQSRSPARKAIVEPADEAASIFFDRIGDEFYGPDWQVISGRKLDNIIGRPVVGSHDEKLIFVRDQLIPGLRAGRITAITTLILLLRPFEQRAFNLKASSVSRFDEDLPTLGLRYPLQHDPLPNDDGLPKPYDFFIAKEFWDKPLENQIVHWQDSEITIEAMYLEPRLKLFPYDREEYDIDEGVNIISKIFEEANIVRRAKFRIKLPMQAIRNLIRFDKLPSKKWLKRYRLYRAEGRLEGVAAAWRLLAILNASSGKLPSAASLARSMHEYLYAQNAFQNVKDHGNNTHSSTLQEMARGILQQFQERNSTASVLVSGNPRNRRPETGNS